MPYSSRIRFATRLYKRLRAGSQGEGVSPESPRAVADRRCGALFYESRLPRRPRATSCGSAEILYVEDNPGDVFLLQQAVLKVNEHVRLVTAGDGEAALALLLSAGVRFSVIVLDLDIPKINGTEVLKVVKSHPELKAVPTVVFAETAARRQIQLAGHSPELFLSKPMDLDGYMVVAEKIVALCVSPD
jgi:chemotaxis family two-component system response regulator Rcp1